MELWGRHLTDLTRARLCQTETEGVNTILASRRFQLQRRRAFDPRTRFRGNPLCVVDFLQLAAIARKIEGLRANDFAGN